MKGEEALIPAQGRQHPAVQQPAATASCGPDGPARAGAAGGKGVRKKKKKKRSSDTIGEARFMSNAVGMFNWAISSWAGRV
jgi:hypothetical protein